MRAHNHSFPCAARTLQRPVLSGDAVRSLVAHACTQRLSSASEVLPQIYWLPVLEKRVSGYNATLQVCLHCRHWVAVASTSKGALPHLFKGHEGSPEALVGAHHVHVGACLAQREGHVMPHHLQPSIENCGMRLCRRCCPPSWQSVQQCSTGIPRSPRCGNSEHLAGGVRVLNMCLRTHGRQRGAAPCRW